MKLTKFFSSNQLEPLENRISKLEQKLFDRYKLVKYVGGSSDFFLLYNNYPIGDIHGPIDSGLCIVTFNPSKIKPDGFTTEQFIFLIGYTSANKYAVLKYSKIM